MVPRMGSFWPSKAREFRYGDSVQITARGSCPRPFRMVNHFIDGGRGIPRPSLTPSLARPCRPLGQGTGHCPGPLAAGLGKRRPLLVESDLQGHSLVERENAKIAAGLGKLDEGSKPAIMRRYGETDDREDEVI